MTDKTSALKDLHTTLIDSHDGYKASIEMAENSMHKQLFHDLMERRSRNADQVRSFLSAQGEQLDDDGSILAAAHRQFTGLRDALSSGDAAVLSEIVRGEKQLLSSYDKALEAVGASDPEFSWLSDQYTDLKMLVDDLKGREARAAA